MTTRKRKRLMVIGNGMAAAATLEEIVKRPDPPDITVFGAEPHANYNRILLSDVLACAKTPGEIFLNPPSWYERHGIELHLGMTITGIDLEGRRIFPAGGVPREYDRLLIATGSTPFIPPMQGAGKEGVFTFRNLEDTESMIRWAARHDRAVVVGGGLLGLEAARGLTNRGVVVTVVHLMGHLMEQQLDETAGELLRAEIEKMGISVRLNTTVAAIYGGEKVEAVRMKTGEWIETDGVLITAGIRPNVSLAKAAGLSVNRGIQVDDRMRTSRPDVYAVGECVEHRGKTYGLVAPIMEQAKVAADGLSGGESLTYEGSVTSTKLKVAGVRLVSMGDFLGKGPGAESLVYMDTGTASYKKVVICDNRVVGAIFLGDGDESGEIQEMIRSGMEVSGKRTDLLVGGPSGSAANGAAGFPETALICNCNQVTKGEIVCAVREKGCATVKQIASETKASTGCGSCAPLVEEILTGILGGAGVGGTGKPRQAGIGKSVNKIELLKKEKDGLDVLEDLHRYAREGWEAISESDVQRLKWYGLFLRNPTPGLFMLRVRIPNGIARADQFRTLAEISDEFGNGRVDLTTRQQVQIRNLRIEKVPEVFERLAAVSLTTVQTGMDSIRNVMGCPVTGLAPNEFLDTRKIVQEFTERFVGNREFSNLPRKMNVTISGCTENCTHAEVQDIALLPAAKERDGEAVSGFNVWIGGKNGSGGFRAATPLDVFVEPGRAAEVCAQLVLIFRDDGPRENRTRARLAFLVESWGTPRLRRELEKRLGGPLERAGADRRDPRKKTDHVGIFRQKEPGLNYVGLLVPVGRMTAGQMGDAARLAEAYGTGEIRLTPDQNLILPGIQDKKLGDFLEEGLLSQLTYNPSEIMRGLVSCTGIEYCSLAVIETKDRALSIARHLEKTVGPTKPVRIHWSGCPAGCGNHTVADIGILGKKVKADGKSVDGADVFAGGRSGPNARGGSKVLEDIPCDRLKGVLEGFARYVVRDKTVAKPVSSPAVVNRPVKSRPPVSKIESSPDSAAGPALREGMAGDRTN
jgi:nitrite reductase (NADH) large subunit